MKNFFLFALMLKSKTFWDVLRLKAYFDENQKEVFHKIFVKTFPDFFNHHKINQFVKKLFLIPLVNKQC